MDYDTERVDDMVLALLHLTTFTEKGLPGARAWKGHDWDALSRLHEKGYLGDPRGKAKSVLLTEEGLRRSEALFREQFGRCK